MRLADLKANLEYLTGEVDDDDPTLAVARRVADLYDEGRHLERWHFPEGVTLSDKGVELAENCPDSIEAERTLGELARYLFGEDT